MALKLAIWTAFLAFFAPFSAQGEAWNCQFRGHGGLWQVVANDLVAPATSGSTHFAIAQQNDDSIIALSPQFQGRHFEMVALDRRRLAIRIFRFDLDGAPDQQEAGQCTRLDNHAVAAARADTDLIRFQIRNLVQQAQNLANQGFITAADLKLHEARDFERMTPQESELISQMQVYVTSRSHR